MGYKWCLGTSLLIIMSYEEDRGEKTNLVFHPRGFWWWQECELVFVQGGNFLDVDLRCLKPGVRWCLGLNSLIIWIPECLQRLRCECEKSRQLNVDYCLWPFSTSPYVCLWNKIIAFHIHVFDGFNKMFS